MGHAVEPFPRRPVQVREGAGPELLLEQLRTDLARLAALALARLDGTTRAVVEVVVAGRTLAGESTARSDGAGRVVIDRPRARVSAEVIVPLGSGHRVLGFVIVSAEDAAAVDGREAELQRTVREVGRAADSLRVLAAARLTSLVLVDANRRVRDRAVR